MREKVMSHCVCMNICVLCVQMVKYRSENALCLPSRTLAVSMCMCVCVVRVLRCIFIHFD